MTGPAAGSRTEAERGLPSNTSLYLSQTLSVPPERPPPGQRSLDVSGSARDRSQILLLPNLPTTSAARARQEAGDDCGADGGTAAPAAAGRASTAARATGTGAAATGATDAGRAAAGGRAATAAARPPAAGGAPCPAGPRAARRAVLHGLRANPQRPAAADGLPRLQRRPARDRAALDGPAARPVARRWQWRRRGHRARRRPGVRGGGRWNRRGRRRADADRLLPRQRQSTVAGHAARAGRRVDHVGPRLAGGGHCRDSGGRRPAPHRGVRRPGDRS